MRNDQTSFIDRVQEQVTFHRSSFLAHQAEGQMKLYNGVASVFIVFVDLVVVAVVSRLPK